MCRAHVCGEREGASLIATPAVPLSCLSLSLSLFLPRLVDEIVWVKTTVNRRLAKSHGYYLQHAKEACLVGRKGAAPAGARACVGADVICAERRGQSQKPEEIYQLVEALVPNGKDGRKNARVAGFFLRLHHLITTSPLSFTHRPLPALSLSQSFTLCTGSYLEIFGRKNNLRDFWVTVGNEVTGKGPPREDVEALAGGAARVPGAVYGAAR